jgi:hypothetical protein
VFSWVLVFGKVAVGCGKAAVGKAEDHLVRAAVENCVLWVKYL